MPALLQAWQGGCPLLHEFLYTGQGLSQALDGSKFLEYIADGMPVAKCSAGL